MQQVPTDSDFFNVNIEDSDGCSSKTNFLDQKTITAIPGSTIQKNINAITQNDLKEVDLNVEDLSTDANRLLTEPSDPNIPLVPRKKSVKLGLIYFKAIICGFLVGIFMTSFRWLSRNLNVARYKVAERLEPWIPQWVSLAFMSMFYIIFSCCLSYNYPPSVGSGIQIVEGTLADQLHLTSTRILPIKYISGIFSIGSGLDLGREGPSIHIASMVGDIFSRITRCKDRTSKMLIAASSGAGLACAFNAPISSVLFVLEELHACFDITFQAICVVFLTTFSAIFVLYNLIGGEAEYKMPPMEQPAQFVLPLFIFVGIVVGIVGMYFTWSITVGCQATRVIPKKIRTVIMCLFAFYIGGLSGRFPNLTNGGEHAIDSLFNSNMTILNIAFVLFVRMCHIQMSYCFNAVPGGIFAPMLSIGASTGILMGLLFNKIMPKYFPSGIIVGIDGMVAMFSAVVQANMTGIVLVLELTTYWGSILHLFLSAVTAILMAHILGSLPVYDVFLHTMLRDKRIAAEKESLKSG